MTMNCHAERLSNCRLRIAGCGFCCDVRGLPAGDDWRATQRRGGAAVGWMHWIVGVSKSGGGPPLSKTLSGGAYLAQEGGCDFHSVAFIRLYSALFGIIRLFMGTLL